MHEDIDVLVVFQDRELVTHIITQIQKFRP